MSYQVLARKWRPRRFDEVVGQEHVTRTLKNALRQGRLAHAFLFTGPRGVGKTSTARILARAVNCTQAKREDWPEPCNECETCQALLEDRELDVIEMDAASYTGVDDIREVIGSARLAPIAGRKKVFIIDEVHMLSKNAFNAFLKTLEEPPENVIFVLATTDVQKVPATILSRVQRFDFRPVQINDIAPHLQKICEDPMRDGSIRWEVEPEALWLIARRAEGSLRDAEGLLDQVISFGGNKITYEATSQILGVLPGDLLADTTRIIGEHRMDEVPEFLENLVQRGVDYIELLRDLQGYWMDLVFLKEGLPLKGKPEEEVTRMKHAGGELAAEDLFRLIKLAEGLEDALKRSTAPRVRFEVSFLRWVTLDRAVTIRDILDRLGSDGPHTGGIRTAVEPNASVKTTPTTTTAPVVRPAVVPTPKATEVASPSGQVTSLDDVKAIWPEIVRLLGKKHPAAAAQAQSQWEPLAFDGRRLTIRCTKPGLFHLEQMKENLPHLTKIFQELTGMTIMLAAATESAPAATQAVTVPSEPAAASSKPAPKAEKNDLFDSFMNRVDGVEIDPKSLRGRKSSKPDKA